MQREYDAIVIGAGHNGLVAAGYLAKNGLSVLVLERTDRVGGACITKEIIKGFRVSAAAQVLGMLRPEIVSDLELRRHGLTYRMREPEAFIPFPDGRYFFAYAEGARTAESLARIAPEDGAAYARYDDYTTRISRVLKGFMLRPAPDLSTFAAAFSGPDGPDMMQCVLFSSLAEYLDRFFATEYAKGPMAYHGLSGSAAGPMTPGTAFSKFYHSTGELTSQYGAWTFALGGMGSVTAALANAVQSRGGQDSPASGSGADRRPRRPRNRRRARRRDRDPRPVRSFQCRSQADVPPPRGGEGVASYFPRAHRATRD